MSETALKRLIQGTSDVMRDLITQKQIARTKKDAMEKRRKGNEPSFSKRKPKKKNPK